MIFLLAPDSFKESMNAKQACHAMEKGILSVMPEATCIKIPMADGGEGTIATLIDVLQGRIFTKEVIGPLGNKVQAEFAISADGSIGIIEMASASCLQLVPAKMRNPLITTTYSTGELINELIERGIKKLIIGIVVQQPMMEVRGLHKL